MAQLGSMNFLNRDVQPGQQIQSVGGDRHDNRPPVYDKATAAKRFLLVEGGTHSNTSWRGQEQVRAALRELFGLGLGAAAGAPH